MKSDMPNPMEFDRFRGHYTPLSRCQSETCSVNFVSPRYRHVTAPAPAVGPIRRLAPRGAAASAVLAILLIGGCAPLVGPGFPGRGPTGEADGAPDPRPDAPANPTAASSTAPALSATEAAELESLLDRADRAIAADHLTYPSSGSALALYDRARLLDPDNERARRGIERIVERYLELATSAADRRRFDDARAMLDRAYIVDPDHAGIAPTRAQIELLDDAERRVIALDGDQLRDRDPALEKTLREAGVASRGDGCRAEITARSDSEGRWIYQQMSAGGGLARIQAQLVIGAPARIEVLCFRP